MRTLLSMLCLSACLFAACKKSNELNTISPEWIQAVTDTSSISGVYRQIAPSPETVVVPYVQYGSHMFSNKVYVYFSNLKDSSTGVAIRDHEQVKVACYFMNSAGDMMRTSRPTETPSGLLVSRGAVFVRLTLEGKPLTAGLLRIGLPPNAKKQRATLPALFAGMTTAAGRNVWTQITASDSLPRVTLGLITSNGFFSDTAIIGDSTIPTNPGTPSGPGDTYVTFSTYNNSYHWINCDYFASYPEPKVIPSVSLPIQFTPQNTSVYYIMNDSLLVTHLYADPGEASFKSYYPVPAGIQGAAVSISEVQGQYYWGYEPGSLPADGVLFLQPTPISLEELRQRLENL